MQVQLRTVISLIITVRPTPSFFFAQPKNQQSWAVYTIYIITTEQFVPSLYLSLKNFHFCFCSLIDLFLLPDLHVRDEVGVVHEGVIVVVHGSQGKVMPVNIEGDREQLWHDAVVGDEGSQAGVNLQETLEYLTLYFWAVFLAYFYLISLL